MTTTSSTGARRGRQRRAIGACDERCVARCMLHVACCTLHVARNTMQRNDATQQQPFGGGGGDTVLHHIRTIIQSKTIGGGN